MITENTKSKLEQDIEDVENKSIWNVYENFTDGNDSVLEGRVSASLHRLQESKSQTGSVRVCEYDPKSLPSEDEIGKTHGGGHYLLEMKIFKEGTKKVEKWPKHFFSLDKTYDRYVAQRSNMDALHDATEIKRMKDSILSDDRHSNNDALTMMQQNHEAMMSTMTKLLGNQVAPPPTDLTGIVTAIGSVVTPIVVAMMNKKEESNPMQDMVNKMIVNQMGKNEGVELKMMEVLERGIEAGKMLSGKVEEKEPTTTEAILAMLPSIAEGVKPLLGAIGKNKAMVKTALKPHAETIKHITNTPKLQEGLVNELLAKGYTQDQINTLSERTDIPLPQSGKVRL